MTSPDSALASEPAGPRLRVMWLSAVSFTVLFAVWLMFGVLVPPILSLVPAAGYLGGVVPGGWRFIPACYAVLLVVTGLVVFFLSPAPDRRPGRGRPLGEMMAPLKYVRVWRFSLYYMV